jgi:hypothetical protein
MGVIKMYIRRTGIIKHDGDIFRENTVVQEPENLSVVFRWSNIPDEGGVYQENLPIGQESEIVDEWHIPSVNRMAVLFLESGIQPDIMKPIPDDVIIDRMNDIVGKL